MSDFTFKQIDKNEYETFLEDESLNIFFKIPDGCKIEDYNIKKTEETPNLVGSPSKAAYFEFTKTPDEETAYFISPLAGLNFLNKSYIKIEEFLSLGDNKEVDDLRVSNALLDNIKANALTGDIYNAKITNCEMANGSVIYINRSEPKLPAYFTTIDNLIFKKKGMLFLDSGINNISKRVITNCVVEEGNFKIFDDGDYKLNNSILSHGEIILNNKNREVIISNSNIKGYNKLENISSIDCSILENAVVSSSKLIGLKDEMIIDQKILDYSASPVQPSQKEVSSNSIITNDIEIL